jgi:YidC/Oxa1 family membrane protein insertase
MDAEDFDDSEIELGVTKPTDLEAARAALDAVKPEDDASVIKFEELQAEMTAEDVAQIVVRMGEEVDLTEKSNPLVWIGKFLGVLTNLSGGNYVISLFYFAVIVEILLLYFGIRQQKDSIKRAQLSPRERAIRKKYAGRNDQKSMQAMNQEIQQMYQEAGASPMSGCLPLLIQMPIVIVLYNIVVDPLRYVLGKAAGLSAALSAYATTARAAGGLGETLSANRGTIELLSKLTPENLAGLKEFSYFSNAGACYDGLSDVLGNLVERGQMPDEIAFDLAERMAYSGTKKFWNL